MKASDSMFGYTKTSKKVFATTNGWDGKDYDGEGRLWPVWKCENDDKTYVRIYHKRCKVWVFLEPTSRLSKNGVQILAVHNFFDAQ